MSFTSANIGTQKLGSVQTLNRDITAMKGTIAKGSLVKVSGYTSRGYNIIDIDSGEELIECGVNIFMVEPRKY